MFENFPYTNFHDLNLDWLIQKVKEAYSPDNPPQDVVVSVNGETGEVILYKDAIVRLPDVEEDTWNIHRVADGTSEGIQFKKGNPAQRIDGTHRYNIYDVGNPPPYPVTSVNGQTGAVNINVPVQSVNGQTGIVVLYPNAEIIFPTITGTSWEMERSTANKEFLGVKFTENGPMKRVDDENEYAVYDTGNPPPYPVTSVGTLTGAVAILDTTIVTDQGTQKLKITFPVSSVDGMTGVVKTWANSSAATLKTPAASDADVWGIVREIVSGDIGIRFEYDDQNSAAAAYIYFDDGVNTPTKIKLLTNADIPSGSGVVSINGQTGAVTLYGTDIEMSSSDSTKMSTAIGNKADKVSSPTNGDFAGLDSNGNLTDSGKKATDFKETQTAVTDPSASGTEVDFISGITQDAQGVISPSKKTVRTMTGASAGAAGTTGLVPAPAIGDQDKYLKGDGTWGTVSGGASDMTGATSSVAGAHGLVPAPAAGDDDAFLRGDGTWSDTPTVNSQAIAKLNTTASALENGLAYIVDGDTCTTAVPVGGYAYIKNNTHSLTEGLYKNTSASAFPTSGGTADSTVFTAVSDVLKTFETKFLSKSISGDTDSDGMISTGLSTNNYVPIAFYPSGSSSTTKAYLFSLYSTNWYITFYNGNIGKLANASISGTLLYTSI